jgi:hypothetical protein
MNAPPIGTRVLLCNGQPRPRRGKWMVENGRGMVSEIGPDFFVVRIEAKADGTPMGLARRSQVIHEADKRFTVTPL